jgi:putative permease
MQTIRAWLERHLNDPQVVALSALLLILASVILFFGNMLAPVFASLVVAYLLEGVVGALERRRIGRTLAVVIVFLLFIGFVVVVSLALIPTLSRQVAQLVENLPNMLDRGQSALLKLPDQYPQLFSREQVTNLLATVRNEAVDFGRSIVASLSLQSVVRIFTLLLYAILVPMLVFFFLKDKRPLLDWLAQFLPRHRHLADTVWHDVDVQIGNYVRGKFIEILIVWSVAYVTFVFFDLQFAMLLGVLVGLSVIIPYVGATAVTIPIAIVAYFQFGASPEFLWIMLAYLIIQMLDGNVLVPLLFSEVVNLHPVAIIIAILIFGGLWGFWGVFFAIPLATVIKAVINAWPRSSDEEEADNVVAASSADTEAPCHEG